MQRDDPIINQDPNERLRLMFTLHHLDIRACREGDRPCGGVPVRVIGRLDMILRERVRAVVQTQREVDRNETVVVCKVCVEG